jgi:hypothetical protein
VSGEAYYHREQQFRELGDTHNGLPAIFKALAAIIHCLNWGDSGDSCVQCSELEALAGLRALAEDDAILPENVKLAIRLCGLCARCAERKDKEARK